MVVLPPTTVLSRTPTVHLTRLPVRPSIGGCRELSHGMRIVNRAERIHKQWIHCQTHLLVDIEHKDQQCDALRIGAPGHGTEDEMSYQGSRKQQKGPMCVIHVCV